MAKYVYCVIIIASESSLVELVLRTICKFFQISFWFLYHYWLCCLGMVGQTFIINHILKQVFTGFDMSYQLQGKFEPRDYCIQYRESDWDFAVRIMEEEGGVLFIGDKGQLLHDTYGAKPTLIGEEAVARGAKIPQSLPRIKDGSSGHERNWANAIRGLDGISNPFETACTLNETMLLGIVAMRFAQRRLAMQSHARADRQCPWLGSGSSRHQRQ